MINEIVQGALIILAYVPVLLFITGTTYILCNTKLVNRIMKELL